MDIQGGGKGGEEEWVTPSFLLKEKNSFSGSVHRALKCLVVESIDFNTKRET